MQATVVVVVVVVVVFVVETVAAAGLIDGDAIVHAQTQTNGITCLRLIRQRGGGGAR